MGEFVQYGANQLGAAEANIAKAGCAIDRGADEIIIYRRPQVAIQTPASTCPGVDQTAKAVLDHGEGLPQYSWSIANGSIVSILGDELHYNVSGPGDAVITVMVTNNLGCDATASTAVASQGFIPQITRQPQSAIVDRGARPTLIVELGLDDADVQWYRGVSGDRSNPIPDATSLRFQTPPVEQTTSYWAEITTPCGTVLSEEATLSIRSRRRAAGHP